MRLRGAYVKSTGAWGRLYIWGTVRSLTEYAVAADVEERQSRCTLCRLLRRQEYILKGLGNQRWVLSNGKKNKPTSSKSLPISRAYTHSFT